MQNISLHKCGLRNLDVYAISAVDILEEAFAEMCREFMSYAKESLIECYPESAIDYTPVFTFTKTPIDYYTMMENISAKYKDVVFYIRGESCDELIDEFWKNGEVTYHNIFENFEALAS